MFFANKNGVFTRLVPLLFSLLSEAVLVSGTVKECFSKRVLIAIFEGLCKIY